MWSNILNYGKKIFWWGQTGVIPNKSEDTPLEELDSNINHFRSKKFTITFIALLIMVALLFCSSIFLFFLPSDVAVNGFVTLFSKTVEVISVIIAVMIGGESLVNLKYNSDSSVAMQNLSQQINENSNQNINETIDDSRSRPDYEEEV